MAQEIRHTIGGVEIVIKLGEEQIEFWAPSIGNEEALGFIDAFHIGNQNSLLDGVRGNLCMYITDPTGRAENGAVAIAVYKPDGVVVGASEGGCAGEAHIYCPQQMAFVIEEPVWIDPKEFGK